MFVSIVSENINPILLWKKWFYLILLNIISITFVLPLQDKSNNDSHCEKLP